MGKKKILSVANWYGSNRMLASIVGKLCDGCRFVAVPFAGGMSEVFYMKDARAILVNDLHRHVINLARVIGDDDMRIILTKRLSRKLFHPDELRAAQLYCQGVYTNEHDNLTWAENYFVVAWMTRSGAAGTTGEFRSGISTRWEAAGGDSAKRYYSAVKSIGEMSRALRRCTFRTDDAFEFLQNVNDEEGHAVYADPPFIHTGSKYTYNCGDKLVDEIEWHELLCNILKGSFVFSRVIVRAYDTEEIRRIYAGDNWTFLSLEGRSQSNKKTPEVLIVNGVALRHACEALPEVLSKPIAS